MHLRQWALRSVSTDLLRSVVAFATGQSESTDLRSQKWPIQNSKYYVKVQHTSCTRLFENRNGIKMKSISFSRRTWGVAEATVEVPQLSKFASLSPPIAAMLDGSNSASVEGKLQRIQVKQLFSSYLATNPSWGKRRHSMIGNRTI